MPDTVTVRVNGISVTMPAGSMVSAAILKTGVYAFRRSASGELRGPGRQRLHRDLQGRQPLPRLRKGWARGGGEALGGPRLKPRFRR